MSSPQKKNLPILAPQVADTSANWSTSVVPIPANVLALDSDKAIIKIGNGVDAFGGLRNHSHAGQYADIEHGHYFGYGEKWFRHQPKLWARHDLINHPELIELNGDVIADERMYALATTFDSDVELIHSNRKSPMLYSAISGNPDIGVLFGPTVDVHSTNDLSDQYESDDLDLVIVATDEFKRTVYSYTLVANRANELQPMADIISPKSWHLLGTSEADGDPTEIIAEVKDNPPMYPNEKRTYQVDVPMSVVRIRFVVTEWNVPHIAEEIKMYRGLRRLYINGRIDGAVTLPNIPVVHSDYAWVVPLKDIGVGLKHEDISDIGFTMVHPELLAANRLPTTGSLLDIFRYEDLYGKIGQLYASASVPDSAWNMTGGTWNISKDDTSVLITNPDDTTTTDLSINVSYTTPQLLNRVEIDFLESDNYANDITLSVRYEGDDAWVKLFDDNSTGMQKFTLPIDATSRPITHFRIVATGWSEAIRSHDGVTLRLYGEDTGKFRLPNLSLGTGTTYIVAEKRLCDVPTNTLLELQQTVASLQNQLVEVTKRLFDAEKKLLETTLVP